MIYRKIIKTPAPYFNLICFKPNKSYMFIYIYIYISNILAASVSVPTKYRLLKFYVTHFFPEVIQKYQSSSEAIIHVL
jgi:hypothetical protein